MSPTFERILMEVFLSSMMLDSDKTIEFLLKSGYIEEYFSNLVSIQKEFKLSYERKLFALAITNMLFNGSNLPP